MKNKTINSIKLTFLGLALSCSGNLFATKWYINDLSTSGDLFTTAVGNDGNAGNAPGAPKLTIAAALALAANGDSILIDAGTYTQNGNFNLDVTQSNLTILGAGQSKTIMQETAGFSGYLFNVTGNDCVIRNIQASSFQYYGAIQINSNSAVDSTRTTITGSYFANNGAFVPFSGTGGGALAIIGTGGMLPAVVTVDDCRFSTNTGDLNGGTIMVNGRSRLVFTNNTLSCGLVTDLTTTDGGGIYFDDAYGTIDNCLFDGNEAGRNGGAIYIDNSTSNLPISIARTQFVNCKAVASPGRGSAIYLRRGIDLAIFNCLFYDNQASTGFGIAGTINMSDNDGNSSLTMTNCTMANNTVDAGGDSGGLAIEIAGANKVNVINCIIYGNSNRDIDNSGGNVLVSNSIIDATGGATFTSVSGNSNSDPLFTNTAASDFTIQGTSPAIDAGTAVSAPLNDLSGSVRDASPDMGAYELGSSSVAVVSVCAGLPVCPTSSPTGSGAQSFCFSDNAIVADLVATGTALIWYDASAAGTAYSSADPLVDGNTYYATQTVGCESETRLAVLVTINNASTPTGAANQSFCSIDNPTVADLVATGTSIQWYAAASGGSPLLTSDALMDATSYFATQTLSSCESPNRLQVDVTVNDPAAPSATAAQSFCSIDLPTVADLSATGAGIQWYAASTGGTALASTDALTDATSYFATQTVGSCESESRQQVDVTINDPAAPSATAAQAFCSINLPTVADLSATGTGILWYANASGGTALAPTDALTDATSYFASQTVGVCESDARQQVDVTVNDPAAPSATAAQSFCSINLPTVADLSATGTGVLWYANASGGTALAPTDALTDATSYFASQTVGVCESDTRQQVDVTVNDPASPTATAAQSFCSINLPTVADLSATGTGVLWYANDSGGTALASTDALTDATSYFASQTVGACESDTRQQVDVTVNDPAAPSGASAQSFCAVQHATIADLAATGTNIIWYDAPNGNVLNSTTALTNGTDYFATQTVGACVSDQNLQVTVTITDPGTPTGANAQSFCTIANPTVADIVAVGAGLLWYDAPVGGNLLASTTLLTNGTTYYATQSLGCESDIRLDVTATLVDPAGPTGSQSQSFCSINLPTVADLAATGSGIQWYSSISGGTALLPTTLLSDGVTYFASQTTGTPSCESTARLDVLVAIADPNMPTGSAAQNFCSIDAPTVGDLVATGTTVQWYPSASGGTALASSVPLTDGTSYFASQTVGSCESDTRFEVLVSINDPAMPTGSANQSFCSIDSPTLANLVASGSGVQWYDASSAGNLLSSTDLLVNGSSYFASQTVGSCESDTRLAVLVSINDPAMPSGAASQNFCVIDNPTLADLTVSGTSIIWYDAATAGNVLPTTTVLVNGSSYYASQTVGTCESDQRLAVMVSLNDPAAPAADTTQEFCLNDLATVANLTATGTTINWYDASTGGNLLTNTTFLLDGTSYFAAQILGSCESTTRTRVDVRLYEIQAAITLVNNPICGEENGSLEVTASNGTAPISFSWSTGETESLLTNLAMGNYSVTVTDANGCTDTESQTLICEIADIPQIITPGGNGQNETWVIGVSNFYPESKVSIFNRWGNEVFSASPYKDDWSGKCNTGFTVGSDFLPSGTYFYIIDLKNGEKPLSGYIELVK